MKPKIRIGAVSYLNTRPLVFGMERGLGAERIELSYAVPSALADQMADGRLDIALLPVIELARIPQLELVPGLGIVTHGPSRSVLLIASRPAEQIASVALDPESRTSNALVQILFAEVWGRRPAFRPGASGLDACLGRCDAAVRIGDKALFEPVPEGMHVYDLGAVWSEKTGLPFVFAAWAARAGAVDREIYRILHESQREGHASIERIVEDYTWNGVRHPEVARSYLEEHIHCRLGVAELRAIERFFRSARAAGLIESVPELRLSLRRRVASHDAAAEAGMAFEPTS